MTITPKQIQAGLQAALDKCKELGSPSSIAIVDDGRNLLGFIRMENAPLASIDISQHKAFTARSLNMKTGDIYDLVQPGGPLWGMERTQSQPMVVFAGGVPIASGGAVIGGVGVAGGMPPDDEAVATAAAEAIAAN